jgi:hypothetical protein
MGVSARVSAQALLRLRDRLSLPEPLVPQEMRVAYLPQKCTLMKVYGV